MAGAALAGWAERQYAVSARNLTLGVSATHLVKQRPPFRQRIVPKPGSVVATAVMGAYDPDPDYFFHWYRDSALVMDALRIAIADGSRPAADTGLIRDFIRFSLDLRGLTGVAVLAAGDPKRGVDPAFVQHVRSDADLRGVAGDRIWGEVRVNPDGTLDTLNWSRPQHDGPALRALTLLRGRDLDGLDRAAAAELLRIDLAFVLAHHREPSFEIWEDSLGHDYYTQAVQCAALREGANWLEAQGESETADRCRQASAALATALDGHWQADAGAYASLLPAAADAPRRALDIAVILGVLHAGLPDGPHSVLDPRAQATLAALEDLFAGLYPINLDRPPGQAPALGRYREDQYYGGGAWYIATLGAAEFHFRLAGALAGGADFTLTADNRGFVVRALGAEPGAEDVASPAGRRQLTAALLARGDAFLATVRAYTPDDGALSEQFDRTTGAQTSARHLGWSYAGFITAMAARRKASVSLGLTDNNPNCHCRA